MASVNGGVGVQPDASDRSEHNTVLPCSSQCYRAALVFAETSTATNVYVSASHAATLWLVYCLRKYAISLTATKLLPK